MEKLNLYEIGTRISSLRRQKGLTQEQLSELMDVSIQMVSNLERGNKAIKIDNLVRISEILEVSTDYLLSGKHTKNDVALLSKKISRLSETDFQMIELLVEYCLNSQR